MIQPVRDAGGGERERAEGKTKTSLRNEKEGGRERAGGEGGG